MDIFAKVVAAKNQGLSLVLATVIDVKGSAPREIGAKMIVWQDGRAEGTIGGGAVEKAVIDHAITLFAGGEAQIYNYDLTELKMHCGGIMSVFLEPIIPRSQLVIFGGGHIGLALTKIADMLDFAVTLVDDRPEFANSQRFPTAQTVLTKPYADVLPDMSFTENTYIVIVTYKHLHDQLIIEHCVQQPFKYLGMIGSKTKVRHSLELLREQNVAHDIIERIHSPIGVNIGAKTPEEIAIAIAAEMIAIRNGADLTTLSMKLSHD
ncbi:xanthine dehydrogenase accessory protein XdhC [candidate division KSB1 bacterium]|nr:xanthine dehydrogenase accessory protein XdhC [candidate division KSB1 bacterium]RQW00854.1 MAG: xanthine dehydrogenase accessory protein XdhC [candidate division KSB1 bacterium]